MTLYIFNVNCSVILPWKKYTASSDQYDMNMLIKFAGNRLKQMRKRWFKCSLHVNWEPQKTCWDVRQVSSIKDYSSPNTFRITLLKLVWNDICWMSIFHYQNTIEKSYLQITFFVLLIIHLFVLFSMFEGKFSGIISEII